ncbi:aminoglycoside phosphotransferase family protein [Gammaproteobacteria bacterium]|nr:aminoglycoside phosphotransferase family protein [Gammaproteobacteria bacterium]
MQNEELKNQINKWALEQLTSLGCSVTDNDVEKILDTPWSYLARYKTSIGFIYLKATPKLFFLEPAIIQLLSDKFNASVPVILVDCPELNCFLMQDAGHNLRKLLKDNFDENLMLRTIEQFTDLQIAAQDKIDIFFDIGVPDYRLEKLPALYARFVKQRDLLASEGLSDSEIDKLEELSDTVVKICNKLSGYNIKHTIVQPDFNDNNTLVDDGRQKITIIDLGEIIISHPFFSPLNFLQQIAKHHGLIEENALYQRLKDACFNKYRGYFTNGNDFNDALAIAKIASEILGIVYQDRFMKACSKENLKQYDHWKLASLLRKFLSEFG